MNWNIGRITRVAVVGGILAATGTGVWLYAQDAPVTVFKSKVDLVVLSFTVTDNKGKYVNGLKPPDFKVLEDGIQQKLATFAEGSKPPMQIMADGSMKPLLPSALEAEKAAGAAETVNAGA